jgi:hypothetical protein
VGIVPDSFLLLNVPDEMLVERVVGGRTENHHSTHVESKT